jgi:hypothetical protein
VRVCSSCSSVPMCHFRNRGNRIEYIRTPERVMDPRRDFGHAKGKITGTEMIIEDRDEIEARYVG